MTYKRFKQIWLSRLGTKVTKMDASPKLIKALHKAADGDFSDFDRIQQKLNKTDSARE